MSPISAAWTDLVFHVLSFIETASGDHSSLYSPEYRNWCRVNLSEALQVLVEEIYRPLSTAYRGTPGSHLLHMFPLLWDSIAAFQHAGSTRFDRMVWPSPDRGRIAAHVSTHLPESLVEMFAECLRITAEAEFEAAWQRAMAPRELFFAPLLRSAIEALSGNIPGLSDATWTISLPLCRHGRSIGCRDGAPWIYVGIPDPDLNVDLDHPVIQGCHELLVWREMLSSPAPTHRDTVPGTEGYDAFIESEKRALLAGEKIFGNGRWRDSYLRWKNHFLLIED